MSYELQACGACFAGPVPGATEGPEGVAACDICHLFDNDLQPAAAVAGKRGQVVYFYAEGEDVKGQPRVYDPAAGFDGLVAHNLLPWVEARRPDGPPQVQPPPTQVPPTKITVLGSGNTRVELVLPHPDDAATVEINGVTVAGIDPRGGCIGTWTDPQEEHWVRRIEIGRALGLPEGRGLDAVVDSDNDCATCGGGPWPGVIESPAGVQGCDECGLFDGDLEAAEALAQVRGGRVLFYAAGDDLAGPPRVYNRADAHSLELIAGGTNPWVDTTGTGNTNEEEGASMSEITDPHVAILQLLSDAGGSANHREIADGLFALRTPAATQALADLDGHLATLRHNHSVVGYRQLQPASKRRGARLYVLTAFGRGCLPYPQDAAVVLDEAAFRTWLAKPTVSGDGETTAEWFNAGDVFRVDETSADATIGRAVHRLLCEMYGERGPLRAGYPFWRTSPDVVAVRLWTTCDADGVDGGGVLEVRLACGLVLSGGYIAPGDMFTHDDNGACDAPDAYVQAMRAIANAASAVARGFYRRGGRPATAGRRAAPGGSAFGCERGRIAAWVGDMSAAQRYELGEMLAARKGEPS